MISAHEAATKSRTTPPIPERVQAQRAQAISLAKPVPGLRGPATRLGTSLLNKTCACGRSQLVPTLPFAHCPECHHTWRSRQGGNPPRDCPVCEFDLVQWRAQMGVTPITPPPIPRRKYVRKSAAASDQEQLELSQSA